MPGHSSRFAHLIAEFGFRDAARPVEWLSILALSAWVQFLVQQPEVFLLPRYAAFSALPPILWALIMICIILTQVLGMLPLKHADRIRFFAMALTTGIWVVIAFSFASTITAPLSARMTGAIAFVTMMTGVYLGWVSQKS